MKKLFVQLGLNFVSLANYKVIKKGDGHYFYSKPYRKKHKNEMSPLRLAIGIPPVGKNSRPITYKHFNRGNSP